MITKSFHQVLRHRGLLVGKLYSFELSDIEMPKLKGKVIVRSGKGCRYREIPFNLDAHQALHAYFAERSEIDEPHIYRSSLLAGNFFSALSSEKGICNYMSWLIMLKDK